MSETKAPCDGYTISTNPADLDPTFILEFLTQQTYWGQNRTMEVVCRSIENSLNFGVFYDDPETGEKRQVGYARVVTDYATFAWLCDVFIDPQHRGQGLSKWLVETVVNHPQLAPLRRILLATHDAHELYRKYGGFRPLAAPERWMEKFNPEA
mgnify:FL=1